VIAIDCSVAAVTVRAKAFEVTPPCIALMLAAPVPAAVAMPEALTLTAAELDENHVAELVRDCVLPSLKVPVALS
jgi:hypothetical protein